MPAAKAVLVDTLAQAARNQEIDASLPEMQRIAKELVAAERDVDQFEGVRLLGLTNDAAEIPLLKQIATSNDPSVRRHNAIEALGYICDPAAKAILEDLAKAPAVASADSAQLHGALATRARLNASWCRKYAGTG
ncbi:MAG: HEAT repeat domain-containing protein [Steroidobacteraceae bacterium]